jgi:hypothetical protein
MAEEKQKKKSSLIIVIVLLLLAAGGGGAGYYFLVFKNKLPTTKNITLSEEILSFSIKTIPELSNALLSLDYELYLIDKELERLDQMEKDYPRQKQIIFSERNTINSIRKNISKSLSDFEKDVEAIFVSHSVNSEKGLEMIEEKKSGMLENSKKALDDSNELTERLALNEDKGFIDKIKDKLMN